jgi:hypothetical protein
VVSGKSDFCKGRGSMQIHIGDISHTIQLAIAPVFLLTGVGTNLLVLTNRLARIIDRSRVLDDRIDSQDDSNLEETRAELRILYRRARWINRAITLSTSCALLICLVVAALFLGDALGLRWAGFIATLFILAMLALIASFLFLLREIFIATGHLAMRHQPGAPHHSSQRRSSDG